MTNKVTALRQALADRIDKIVDFQVYPNVPDSIVPPCAWISPDTVRFADYEQTYSSLLANWRFRITVLSSPTMVDMAQDAIDEFLDPAGTLITALRDVDRAYDDSLRALTKGYVRVLSAAGYSGYTVGDAAYMGAQLLVEIKA